MKIKTVDYLKVCSEFYALALGEIKKESIPFSKEWVIATKALTARPKTVWGSKTKLKKLRKKLDF